MDNTTNICEGCKSYKLLAENSKQKMRGCAIEKPFISNSVKCSCLDCIVKVICDDMCYRYKVYAWTSRTINTFEKRIDQSG